VKALVTIGALLLLVFVVGASLHHGRPTKAVASMQPEREFGASQTLCVRTDDTAEHNMHCGTVRIGMYPSEVEAQLGTLHHVDETTVSNSHIVHFFYFSPGESAGMYDMVLRFDDGVLTGISKN
jgi:hypothetical protein